MTPVIPYPINALVQYALDAGIDDVIEYPDPRCPRARYVFQNGTHLIFMNPTLLHDEMRCRCLLAHEISHFILGVGADVVSGALRDEAKARRHARQMLMPDWWIVPRLHLPVWEIAEQAGVYQEWASARIRDMERMLVYA